MANIAPSVIASAVVNITGNMAGLRHAMNETRTQLYGYMTLANAFSGKFYAALFNPIAARFGMRSIDQAMRMAEKEIEQRMADWKATKPVLRRKPSSPTQADWLMDPDHARFKQDLVNIWKREKEGFPALKEAWQAMKPNAQAIREEFVQGAAQMHGKLLLLGGAIAGVAGVFASAIKYASDFTEALNKTIGTFGSSTARILQGASGSASRGMGRTAYLEATSTFGIELLGAGMAEDMATSMSEGLSKRAVDVASFYNRDVGNVFEKFRAGLAGFGRPLRELGVHLTEHAVRTKAAAMGLKFFNGELSEEDRIRARVAIIMDQTKRAEGDFERTSGGFANQMRILQANFGDLMTGMGKEAESLAVLTLPLINGLFSRPKELAGKGPIQTIQEWITGYDTESDAKTLRMQTSRQNRLAREQIKEEELAGRKAQGVRHMDLASYAKHLQESLFDKNHARDQLNVLKQIAANTKKTKPGGPMGPVVPGINAPGTPF